MNLRKLPITESLLEIYSLHVIVDFVEVSSKSFKLQQELLQ